MFAPPSLQKEYALVFSGDPALALPTDEKERANVLRVARETGQWDGLLKVGERPTLFRMRQLPGSTRTWLGCHSTRKKLLDHEVCELALRLALRAVDNFGAFTLSFHTFEDQALATVDIIDAICAIGDPIGQPDLGRQAVAELGGLVIKRTAEGVPPK